MDSYKEISIKRLLKAKDISKILGCSMTRAYALLNQHDFPKIVIGKYIIFPKKHLING